MQITVADLKEYLESYDDEAVVKFSVNDNWNNYTIALDYGFISESTEEVYGKEIIIHPYFPPNSEETDDLYFDRD